MSRIENIVLQLKEIANMSTLRSKHAAAVIINNKILSTGINTDRTYNRSMKKSRNTSICCSTHAEISAIRKALTQRKCIL